MPIPTIANLTLGQIPRVAAPFTDATTPDTLAQAARQGLDIAELRVDQFADPTPNRIIQIADAARPMPVILTIRSAAEGGQWKDSKARLPLFEQVIDKVDAIDIELSSSDIIEEVIAIAHNAGKTLIASYHNFNETPTHKHLETLLLEAQNCGAHILKVATMPNNQNDLKTLAAFTATAEHPVVTIAMGERGAISRILFPALGSLFTFANFGHESAPGQLNYAQTARLLAQFYPEYKTEKSQALRAIETQS